MILYNYGLVAEDFFFFTFRCEWQKLGKYLEGIAFVCLKVCLVTQDIGMWLISLFYSDVPTNRLCHSDVPSNRLCHSYIPPSLGNMWFLALYLGRFVGEML